MKISSDQAATLARILERYYIYADRFMSVGFGTHPENIRNNDLFVETAEDLSVIATLYPAFSGGMTILDGVNNRIQNSQLPDPRRHVGLRPVSQAPTEEDIMSLIGPSHEEE